MARPIASLVFILVLTACTSTLPTARSTPVPHPGLYVDAGERLGPISPNVFGSNTGPWAYFAPKERELFKQAGIRMIRWPGGNWGDENDPLSNDVDDYIQLCHDLGAEPLVHVRLLKGSPEKAAEMVRLFNKTKGFKVHYWAVGNEPDLYATKRKVPYTVADYVRDFKAFRAAMRAVDPSIVVMGPEISQYTGTTKVSRDANGVQWMDGFLKGIGTDVDMISFHRYPFGQPPATAARLRDDPPSWSRAMEYLTQQIHSILGKDLPIGATEVNSDWAGWSGLPAGPDSQLSAIWWADVLGRLISTRATIVGQFALGRVKGISLVGGYWRSPTPNPSYQVYLLYRHFGTESVRATFDDDHLPLFAARRDDGTLTLLIVNHDERARTSPIMIDGVHTTGAAEVWSFATNYPVQRRGTADLSQPVTFEPNSATMLIVPP